MGAGGVLVVEPADGSGAALWVHVAGGVGFYWAVGGVCAGGTGAGGEDVAAAAGAAVPVLLAAWAGAFGALRRADDGVSEVRGDPWRREAGVEDRAGQGGGLRAEAEGAGAEDAVSVAVVLGAVWRVGGVGGLRGGDPRVRLHDGVWAAVVFPGGESVDSNAEHGVSR